MDTRLDQGASERFGRIILLHLHVAILSILHMRTVHGSIHMLTVYMYTIYIVHHSTCTCTGTDLSQLCMQKFKAELINPPTIAALQWQIL